MISKHNDHPFWQYLPAERKSRLARLNLSRRRAMAWMQGKKQRISVVLVVYTLIWSVPLYFGQSLITVLALIPLLLVPPVGFLIYHLVWQEFHE